MKKTLFLLISFILLSILTIAQTKSFPADSVKFPKKLEKFLATRNKEKTKVLMQEFNKEWEEGVLTSKYKSIIYKETNLLLKKRARPFPHFENYLHLIIAFAKGGTTEDNFVIWQEYFEKVVRMRKFSLSKLNNLLSVSRNLLESQSLYKNTTVNWTISNNNFKFIPKGLHLEIQVDKTDLTCFTKGDSSKIYNTKGHYDVDKLIWKGDKGLITWERSKISRDSVYAELKSYHLMLKKSNYSLDTVFLTNKFYFSKPIEGSLKDKVVNTKSSRNLSYPQFHSFKETFRMDKIFKDVNYIGGFSMKGIRFFGSGTKENLAQFTFFRKDTLVLKVKSTMFIFKKNQVISNNAIVIFPLDTDSIYHPGLKFNYTMSTREVLLTRNKENIGRTPFSDTYHGVDMNIGKIRWKMGTPKLEFLPGPIQSITYLESNSYYSEDKYMDLQKMDDINPLVAVRRFVRKNGNDNNFYDNEFADFMRMSLPAIHRYILKLAFQGYLTYVLETGVVTVKPKLYHYLKSSVGKEDYDIISFMSNAKGKSGEMSLLNYNVKMEAIDKIFLSDSQNVVVYPQNGEIILKRNRDFAFDGYVNAGLFQFVGSNFDFHYSDFKIDLNNVETVQMYVKSKTEFDKFGDPVLIPVQTQFHDVKGDLLIDKPYNKSGIKKAPEYPIFNSKKKSYVYYDAPSIQNGAYEKEEFYIQLEPYSFDSLDNFKNKSLRFKGFFNSAGILPDMNEDIYLRPDLSLGFRKKSPADGFPIYKGKARLFGDIDLSNKGLLSQGEIKYLYSVTKSSDIILLPKELKAKAESFINKKITSSPEFPQVEGIAVDIDWFAYQDSMLIKSLDNPIQMYDKLTYLSGTLLLRSTGMYGSGLLDLTKAELNSDLFHFESITMDADTSAFRLKTEGDNGFDFKTDDVNAHLDYKERKGVFKSNGEASFVEFPKNQYICYMDQFDWYMDKEMLEMSASDKAQKKIKSNEDLGPLMEEDVELSGSQFISIHPRQDSLNFIAPKAKYNIRKKLITAEDVRYIRVADAIIYPDSGTVEIEKRAVMRTLKNSKIIANSATRYHTIFNAATNIYGRKEYTSSGDYDFVDGEGVKERIHFNVIGVDSTMQTYARGEIGITENFTFNPQFAYTGKVNLFANDKDLSFIGYTKLSHDCDLNKKEWIKFDAKINPEDVLIPITSPIENINGTKLHASLMIGKDSIHIYPAFLSPHITHGDLEIVSAEGYLLYDKNDGAYKISNKDKLEEASMPGNLISLHHSICNIHGEGTIHLGDKWGQFDVKTAGYVNQNATAEKTSLEMVMFLKFFFNNKCLNIMADDLNKATEGTDMNNPVYFKGITEILGSENVEEYISNLNLGSLKKYPKEFEKGIVFSSLKMEWNPKTQSFISKGPIGIGSILKNQVNKMVNGVVEIEKKRRSDKIYIYLEVDESTWYYFQYGRGVLRVVSSNEEFNTTLRNLKPDDRKQKIKKGEKPFSFYPTTAAFKKKYLKKFEEKEEEPTEENENTEEDDE